MTKNGMSGMGVDDTSPLSPFAQNWKSDNMSKNLSLTRLILWSALSLLHDVEIRASQGNWSGNRWSAFCDAATAFRERCDLPAGYTDEDDAFSEVSLTVLKEATAGVWALRPAPTLFEVPAQTVTDQRGHAA